MLLIALTVLVVAAWYLFVTAEGPEGGTAPGEHPAPGAALPASTRVVLAGAGASGQIVLTCLALGTTGMLTVDAVAIVTLATTIGLLGWALRSREVRGRLAASARGDASGIALAARASLGWETGILAALLLFEGIWLVTAVAYYSPRGVDDILYHLPPVYEAVQTHRFQVLPLQLREFFAFPFNAEMLFLWVTILTGGIAWVDGTQILSALLGIAAVFALGRQLGLRPRGAFFAAALFGAMPVVFLQAASNYIDVIVNAWILAAAVALLAYQRSGSRVALFVGGLTTGLLLGSKYQAILFAAALAWIAFAAALGRGLRGARLARPLGLFAVPAAAAGLYWYLRNWLWFSNPFFPLPVTLFGATIFPGDWKQGPPVWSALLKDPIDALRIAAWDPGLGSFNGGLGFLFWGLGLAMWLRLLWRRTRQSALPRPWLSPPVLILGLVPVGLFTFALTPFDDLAFTPRYVLSIAGIAFVALAVSVEEAAESFSGAATGIRAAGVLASGLALLLGGFTVGPLLDLSSVAGYPPDVRRLGEMVYLKHGFYAIGWMSEGWAPLEAMTRGDAGLTVYQATDYKSFWTGPTYGTRLQNRTWNFATTRDQESDPDAYFFHSPSRTPFYIGKEVDRETVAADPAFELVASNGDDVTTLYVSRRRLAEKGRRERLVDFYKTLRPALVRDTAPAAEAVSGGTLLVTFPIASAFLVHEAEGRLHGELLPVTMKELETEGARRSDRPVYTLGAPLPGRHASAVRTITISGRKLNLFRNDPVDAGGAGAAPAAPAGGDR